MENKLQQLFDYQKFENNKELAEAIKKCEQAADSVKERKKEKQVYRRIAFTMTASAVAAAFFLVVNSVFAGGYIETGGLTGVASVFSEKSNGLIVAGTILAFGVILSVILYIKGKRNRKSQ